MDRSFATAVGFVMRWTGVVWAFVALAFLACGDLGRGCGGARPLAVALPPDQTVESATQVRLTASGFARVSSAARAEIAASVSSPSACLPPASAAGGRICDRRDGGCNPGCEFDIAVEDVSLSSAGSDELRVVVTADAAGDVYVAPQFGTPFACAVTVNNARVEARVAFSIDDATGEARIGVTSVTPDEVNPQVAAGCTLDADSIETLADWLAFEMFTRSVYAIESVLVASLPPAVQAELVFGEFGEPGPGPVTGIEYRSVPGGHLALENSGLSLGFITSFNSDLDRATRSAALDSEPALCVPPRAFDLAAAPYSMPLTSRGTFGLAPADAFRGIPDPSADIMIGVSETSFDLFAHHAFASGTECLQLGWTAASAIGVRLTSLTELGLLRDDDLTSIVVRPQRAFDVTLGDGTPGSPHLTLRVADFAFDVYAVVRERPVRLFTLVTAFEVGINLEVAVGAGGDVDLVTTLAAFDSSAATVSVTNRGLVREDDADLEMVGRVILDLLVPIVGGASLPLPEMTGFSYTGLRVTRVITPEEEFLTILSDLGPSVSPAAVSDPFPAPTLREVEVPDRETIRRALLEGDRSQLPRVNIDVPTEDANGAPLEWAWRLDGGVLHPFARGANVTVQTPALAGPGRYELELVPRVVGMPMSLRDSTVIAVDLDPAMGALDVSTTVADVYGPAPASGCVIGGTQDGGWPALFGVLFALGLLVRRRGRWSAFAFAIALFATGCSCGETLEPNDAGEGDAGLIPLDGTVVDAAVPIACDEDDDCDCGEGTVPMCVNDLCICADELAVGRVGVYSELALGPDGRVWIAAYNTTYGDLMVASSTAGPGRIPEDAYEFVDGVPDGPIEIPDGVVRGGVRDPGPNVGLHTDIAVAPDGTVYVTYFDADTLSLRIAIRRDGAWRSHTIDGGQLPDETGFEIAGRYSAITLSRDGLPGVGYLAIVDDGTTRSEVRFASPLSASPSDASDWLISVADQATTLASVVPTDPVSVPEVRGLYVTAARDALGAPMLAYYDFLAGTLWLTTYDLLAGVFRTPRAIAGGTRDSGRYPSIVVDDTGVVHVAYLDVTRRSVCYAVVDSPEEIVDDGYRIDEIASDGVPVPVFHEVGADASLTLSPSGPTLVYQDATSHELMLAVRGEDGVWTRRVLAGAEDPFVGSYGFHASSVRDAERLVASSWVIDAAHDDAWVEIFEPE